MDDLLSLIERQHDLARQERRRTQDEVALRECVVAACHAVAAWGPDSVVEPGWRPVEQDDTVVQLAWTFCDLARAIDLCSLTDHLGIKEEGEPARAYALALLVLAGRDGKHEELERCVRAAWTEPAVWREVAGWIRRLPALLWPVQPQVTCSVVEARVIRTLPDAGSNREGQVVEAESVPAAGSSRREDPRGRHVRRPSSQAAVPFAHDLPQEVTTAQAAEILGVSKDTVLVYRARGLLPARNIAPPGSTKPIYMFPRDAVVSIRTTYDTEQPAPSQPREPTRRRMKGENKYKHLRLDEEA